MADKVVAYQQGNEENLYKMLQVGFRAEDDTYHPANHVFQYFIGWYCDRQMFAY